MDYVCVDNCFYSGAKLSEFEEGKTYDLDSSTVKDMEKKGFMHHFKKVSTKEVKETTTTGKSEKDSTPTKTTK
jgi:hypothetical protein